MFKQISDRSYLTTQPDEQGQFRSSVFAYDKSADMYKETTVHYQEYREDISVPKHLAAEIQQRIDEAQSANISNLQKEDAFFKTMYFMPAVQKSVFLRNTQRQCTICGGPHLLSQCPLRAQRRLQINRPTLEASGDVTYSVMLDPLPRNFERRQIEELVVAKLQAQRDRVYTIMDEIEAINAKIDSETDQREIEILEWNKQELEKKRDDCEEATRVENTRPVRIAILSNKDSAVYKFAYVHFKNEKAALLFAEVEKIKIEGDNTYMAVQYKGKRDNARK